MRKAVNMSELSRSKILPSVLDIIFMQDDSLFDFKDFLALALSHRANYLRLIHSQLGKFLRAALKDSPRLNPYGRQEKRDNFLRNFTKELKPEIADGQKREFIEKLNQLISEGKILSRFLPQALLFWGKEDLYVAEILIKTSYSTNNAMGKQLVLMQIHLIEHNQNNFGPNFSEELKLNSPCWRAGLKEGTPVLTTAYAAFMKSKNNRQPWCLYSMNSVSMRYNCSNSLSFMQRTINADLINYSRGGVSSYFFEGNPNYLKPFFDDLIQLNNYSELEALCHFNLPTKLLNQGLSNAAKSGFLETAQVLLEYGAEIEIGPFEGDSPFLTAVIQGDLDLCKLLLSYKPLHFEYPLAIAGCFYKSFKEDPNVSAERAFRYQEIIKAIRSTYHSELTIAEAVLLGDINSVEAFFKKGGCIKPDQKFSDISENFLDVLEDTGRLYTIEPANQAKKVTLLQHIFFRSSCASLKNLDQPAAEMVACLVRNGADSQALLKQLSFDGNDPFLNSCRLGFPLMAFELLKSCSSHSSLPYQQLLSLRAVDAYCFEKFKKAYQDQPPSLSSELSKLSLFDRSVDSMQQGLANGSIASFSDVVLYAQKETDGLAYKILKQLYPGGSFEKVLDAVSRSQAKIATTHRTNLMRQHSSG